MFSEAVAFDLVERIYAAGEEPRLWNVFLDRLARAVHGTASAMVSDDIRAAQPEDAMEPRFSGVLSRAYEEYCRSRSGGAVAGAMRGEPGEVVTREALTPLRDFADRKRYDDLFGVLRVRHLLGGIIFREPHRISWVSSLRPGRGGAFGDEETALLRLLLPHFRRALELHGRLAEQGCQCAAMLAALDGIPAGMLLLDHGGRPLIINKAAHSILDSRDGLDLGPDGMTAARVEDNRELRRLIAQAAGADARTTPSSIGAMGVSRPSQRRAFSVFVKPIRAAGSSNRARPAVVMFVVDPDRRIKADGCILQSLYGFTLAESRMAVQLIQGESVEETARDLDVSLNTARTHMKHLFEKTDTHCHRELVRLLLCSSCCSCAGPTPRNAHHGPHPRSVLNRVRSPYHQFL